jgi:hypothetical protein
MPSIAYCCGIVVIALWQHFWMHFYMAEKKYQSCLVAYENEIIALRRKKPPMPYSQIAELLRDKYQSASLYCKKMRTVQNFSSWKTPKAGLPRTNTASLSSNKRRTQ